ncbi:hypothetical protein Bbelb_097320 [Branchiostoma belcheri]|nr:hypothetical protein Bbelb_097320 [Branchiostoma belcheri]
MKGKLASNYPLVPDPSLMVLAWVPDCCQGQYTGQLLGSRSDKLKLEPSLPMCHRATQSAPVALDRDPNPRSAAPRPRPYPLGPRPYPLGPLSPPECAPSCAD